MQGAGKFTTEACQKARRKEGICRQRRRWHFSTSPNKGITMTKKTPLYDEHVKLGGKMVEFAGWEMPVKYSDVTEEHLAVRNAVGLFDVSHMGVFEVTGDGAAAFLDYLTPSDNAGLADYQAQYSLLLTDAGTAVDDIIIYRITPTRFLMVVNASNLEKDFNWIKNHLKGNAQLKNLTDIYGLIALQGPKAASLLSKTTKIDIDAIKGFHLKIAEVGGAGEVIIARTGYTGEDGFELFVARDKMPSLWKRLLDAGKDLGIKPIGLGARDTLRLEMKYSLYGHEITSDTNALEAGLRWVIKFKKPSDFVGKDALLRIKDEGIKRKLIGFKMIDRGIPRHGYLITSEKRQIGAVTSGTFSPSLQAPIGIGYVEIPFGKPGSKFSVDIRGKERQAEVVQTPFVNKGS